MNVIKWILVLLLSAEVTCAQQSYQVRSFLYNSVSGAVLAATGALLTKKKEDKPLRVFLRGLGGGFAGGAIQYAGKRSVNLIVTKHEQGYGWLSRLLFSAGSSIIENAAYNKKYWSSFHLDLAFIRLETDLIQPRLRAYILPAETGAFIFASFFGRPDWNLSLRSGTFVFRTNSIRYAPYLIGSTSGNHYLLNDTIGSGRFFHEIVAHETIHAFQFSEFSALNAWIQKPVNRWKEAYPFIRKSSEFIHGDINYAAMLVHYFIFQGGYSRTYYCRNFLENEAEVLSTGRFSCPSCGCN